MAVIRTNVNEENPNVVYVECDLPEIDGHKKTSLRIEGAAFFRDWFCESCGKLLFSAESGSQIDETCADDE